mmetsp:Transcript_16367/g.37377  ORF Transcript_16367/g.37377 Transcript_16367/m.37377 type:complete len:102 (-) Transcript_16367:64-369(-)
MEGSILSPLSSAWSPEPPPWSRDLLSSTISLEYCKPWTKSGHQQEKSASRTLNVSSFLKSIIATRHVQIEILCKEKISIGEHSLLPQAHHLVVLELLGPPS